MMLDRAREKMPGLAAMRAIDLLRWPGVMVAAPLDQERLAEQFITVVEQATFALLQARASEGAKLAQLIVQRLQAMSQIVAEVEQILPEIAALQQERLRKKLEEVSESVDQERLEQELVLLLNKADVAEELDRLKVHIEEVGLVLEQSKPAGRRLDFLMQELNREANTLGSKSVDARLTKASVDLKVLIEQMREQVQNIE